MKTIYLAGPVRGLSFKDARGWRVSFAGRLAALVDRAGQMAYRTVDPTATWVPPRSEEYDRPYRYPVGHSFAQEFARDRADVLSCDYLLANFYNADAVSVFSVMEAAWAYQAGRHVVLVLGTEKQIQPHDHPALRHCASVVVDSLDDAVDYFRRRLQ